MCNKWEIWKPAVAPNEMDAENSPVIFLLNDDPKLHSAPSLHSVLAAVVHRRHARLPDVEVTLLVEEVRFQRSHSIVTLERTQEC